MIRKIINILEQVMEYRETRKRRKEDEVVEAVKEYVRRKVLEYPDSRALILPLEIAGRITPEIEGLVLKALHNQYPRCDISYSRESSQLAMMVESED